MAEYSQALPDKADEGPWYERGVAHVQLGKWEQAADDFARAARTRQPPPEVWSALALVRLRRDDLPGYREACTRLLERHARAPGWSLGGLAPERVCSAGPEAVTPFKQVVDLVDTPSSGTLGGSAGTNVKAAVYYRAGRCEEAAKLLAESAEEKVHVPPQDHFFLAMARQRLGQAGEARQTLARGVERLKELERERGKEKPAVLMRSWQERLEEQLLRREAERLLEGKQP